MEEVFFETGGLWFAMKRRQMSGNPVRVGDGYATVTGYELPDATPQDADASEATDRGDREGGSEDKPQVRIPV